MNTQFSRAVTFSNGEQPAITSPAPPSGTTQPDLTIGVECGVVNSTVQLHHGLTNQLQETIETIRHEW